MSMTWWTQSSKCCGYTSQRIDVEVYIALNSSIGSSVPLHCMSTSAHTDDSASCCRASAEMTHVYLKWLTTRAMVLFGTVYFATHVLKNDPCNTASARDVHCHTPKSTCTTRAYQVVLAHASDSTTTKTGDTKTFDPPPVHTV
jgi:hypothetical protein